MKQTAENAPLKELDDWDDFVATRYRQGKSEEEFRNYKADGVLPSKPCGPDTRFRLEKKGGILRLEPRQEGYLGNG